MKTIVILATLALIPATAMASTCKKGQTQISCANVEGKQREFFCWKGKPKAKKMEKICKSVAKSQATKKAKKS